MPWNTAFMLRQPSVELFSRLPLEICCRQLDAQIDSSWRVSGDQPLIGRRTGTSLQVRPRIFYRNSFQTYLTATLSAQGTRTLVRCKFGPHPLVIAFMALWFFVVVSIGGTTIVSVLSGFVSHPESVPSDIWPGAAIPAAMMLAGIGMVLVGRYLARGERDDMLAIISRTLQATPRA